MKAVILGMGGQLANALVRYFPDGWFIDRTGLDIGDSVAVEGFGWNDRDVIINAAAYTKVDEAQTPDGQVAAHRTNVEGVRHLVKAAQAHNLTLVHVSSEYVFDGTAKWPISEGQRQNPLNVYGHTKAEGDRAVMGLVRYYIIRTSWVVGSGANFVRTMMWLAENGVKPKVVNDQIGRLTFTDDLARGIRHLLDERAPYGVYNLTASGPPVSWAEVAREVFELCGRDPGDVQAVSTHEYFGEKLHAPRPCYGVLDLGKIKGTGFSPYNWRDSLASYVTSLDPGGQ